MMMLMINMMKRRRTSRTWGDLKMDFFNFIYLKYPFLYRFFDLIGGDTTMAIWVHLTLFQFYWVSFIARRPIWIFFSMLASPSFFRCPTSQPFSSHSVPNLQSEGRSGFVISGVCDPRASSCSADYWTHNPAHALRVARVYYHFLNFIFQFIPSPWTACISRPHSKAQVGTRTTTVSMLPCLGSQFS